MKKTILSRQIPRPISRQLRQESGFGCAVCGNPILEYHHIIPWAEKNHFDCEHMVALCPNHHAQLGKQDMKYSYREKSSPFNIRTKKFKGYLVTNKKNQPLLMGNNRIIGFSNSISYFGIPLIGHSVVDEEIRVSCFMPDYRFFPEVEVKDNDLQADISEIWDIEFKQNFVKIRRSKGEVFLSFDFRGDDAVFTGVFQIGNTKFKISESGCDFDRSGVFGATLSGPASGTAITYGDPSIRLQRPNYAMSNPKATYIRV